MNKNFEKVFTKFNTVKEMLRNVTCDSQLEVLRDRYREAMELAKQTFSTYSTPEKFKAFKQRENGEVTAILQAYKRRKLEILNNNCEFVKHKSEYELYDNDSYESDLESEKKYWNDELFPEAFKGSFTESELILAYNYHLTKLPWCKKAGNPSTPFLNEMRRQYSIYRRKQVGEDTSFFEKIGPFA